MININNVVESDLDKVIDINHKYLNFKFDKEYCHKCMVRFGNIFLVAKNNNEIIGYIIGKIEDYEHVAKLEDFLNESKLLNIISLAVDEKYRGKGIGENLIKTLLSTMYENCLNHGYLYVALNNKSALNLYYKLGFKYFASILNPYENGINYAVMFI